MTASRILFLPLFRALGVVAFWRRRGLVLRPAIVAVIAAIAKQQPQDQRDQDGDQQEFHGALQGVAA